jgi:hypothetical protein
MGYDYGVLWAIGTVLAVLLLCLVWYIRGRKQYRREVETFRIHLKPKDGWRRTFPYDR